MSTQRPKPYNWEEETDWRNRDPWEELPRRRGARRRGVPVLVFLLCLLLIAGVTAALVLTAWSAHLRPKELNSLSSHSQTAHP